MRKVSKIFSVFVALGFFLSTAGVFFVKHTCMHSEETSLLLSEKHDCCEHFSDDNSSWEEHSGEGACPVHGDHKNCCVNDIVYLKSDSEFQKPENRNSVEKTNYQLFELHQANNFRYKEHAQLFILISPPPGPPRDSLIRYNILIL